MECVSPSQPLLAKAIQIHYRHNTPWYDALIVAAALESDCSTLLSEDFQHGQVFEGTLTVINPFAIHKN
jgi:predicted nucleic acid-binding protein